MSTIIRKNCKLSHFYFIILTNSVLLSFKENSSFFKRLWVKGFNKIRKMIEVITETLIDSKKAFLRIILGEYCLVLTLSATSLLMET